jgi:hypothetical protein
MPQPARCVPEMPARAGSALPDPGKCGSDYCSKGPVRGDVVMSAAQVRSTYSSAMAESPRRFPAPWRADKVPGGYVVRDANGQALAYVYSRDKRGRSAASKGAHKRRGATDPHQHCPACWGRQSAIDFVGSRHHTARST